MPEQSSRWICWRFSSVISIGTLWILIHYNSGKVKLGRTNDIVVEQPTTSYPTHVPAYKSLPSGFLINNPGCRIPYLDPFEPSIKEFIFEEKAIKCSETYGMALVESNLTALFINESALAYYNITDINELRCCYTPFWRVEFKKNINGKYPDDVDSQIRFADTCTQFTNQVTVTDEFVKVHCFLGSSWKNNCIYTDFHAFTPMKTFAKTHENNALSKKSVSVLIIGVDTVSRLNFHRQMPLTVNFLKSNLSAIEFLGYNKVGNDTFLNLIPVLTGLYEQELKKSCWPSEDSVFDGCSFVWDSFRAAGYTTAFAEDAPWMGLFHYNKLGFRKQPTDYYAKPFNYLAEEKIGFDNRSNTKLCVGPRKNIETLLNYVYKFSITMKDVLSFGWIWECGLGHDFVNLPKQGDKHYKELLERLYSDGIFNRTILVYMSDHGMRWGGIQQTYQGHFEERLPFLYIAYPDWFGQQFTTAVRNLKINAHKLTTPFDLHETLLELTNLVRIKEKILKIRSYDLGKNYNLPRGISLFLPIPDSRTCKDAGIVDHWCTCHESESVPTNVIVVKRAADFLVVYINSLIIEYPDCARLQLQNITNAREEKATFHRTFKSSDGGLTDFFVTIETVPGEGMFESTVRYNLNTHNFTIVGTVSRINLYGNQSSCISNARLRPYCYCTNKPVGKNKINIDY